MHSNRFIIKEELSVSDTVLKITDEIYYQILNRLKSGKSFISKERNVVIKKGIFDYQTTGKLKNTSFIKVKYVVYYFNNEQEHQAYMKYGYFRMNSSADYENKTINLYLSMINNQPDPDFKSDIQHEVNHIFQYDNGQQKDEDFYKRIIELNKSGNKLDKIIARAMYYTFQTEQDSFVSQYYTYLKRNNIPIQQAINYRDDKNCPYYDFDNLFDYIGNISDELNNISDELTDVYTQNKLGMSSRKMFMILNNADDSFRNKLGKVIMRYVQEKELSEEFKHSGIHLKIDPRLSFILECYKKGINEEESEYFGRGVSDI